MLSPTESSAWPLLCPVCEAVLARTGRALQCPNRHSFDFAKEGYVNLLLSHGSRGRITGDAPAMVKARRSFLSAGFYSPLSDLLNRCVAERLAESLQAASESPCIAEAGCGEGYYLCRLRRHLEAHLQAQTIRYFGFDISKAAVKTAAKQHPPIRFVVADVKRKLPFDAKSIQFLLNIFSPRNAAEFERVLVDTGSCFVVIPGPEHLSSLRREFGLLEIEPNKLERVKEQIHGFFRVVQHHTLEFDLNLGGEKLLQLVRMSPNYWHASEEVCSRLLATAEIHTQASFSVLELRRQVGV